MEARLAIALVLMGAVLFLTPYFHKPEPASPPKKDEPKAAAPAAAAPASPAPAAPAAAAAPAAPVPASTIAAAKEETVVVQTELYRVEITNRGALVKSWILRKFKDANGKPLDLVNPAGVKAVGYPFALDIKGRTGWAPINNALFQATPIDGGYRFEYSDGRTRAVKTFRFPKASYLSDFSSELTENGVAVPHLIVWRGGFGDWTVSTFATNSQAVLFNVADNKLVSHKADFAKNAPVSLGGNFAFAGFADAYFAIVRLQQGGGATELTVINDLVPDTTGEKVPVVGGSIGGEGRNTMSLFVGPKDYSLLKSVDPRLDGLIDFGWSSFLAKPLFVALKYVNDHWVRNWGWSIVLVTVIINILLLPLKISSLNSMRKMSLVQPEMQAINDKYKGLSIKDPKMANKNEEIMALYKKHGVNPAGGCLPLLLQFPFLFAFYAVLSVAIELRQSGWLWVNDLSQPETIAIRVLPLIMIASQFWMQKMSPPSSMDPAQQRMMLMMPLVFGFMFYGAQSGLVLYWLTGNVVAIVQQWIFNKTMPAPAPAVINTKPVGAPKRKSK